MGQLVTAEIQHLPASVQRLVTQLLTQVKADKIVLFGSRARGDHRENSDFDIAVALPPGEETAFRRFVLDLDEMPLTLFGVDLVNMNTLDQAYLENIHRDGKVLYG